MAASTDPTGPPASTPEFAGSDASSTQTAALSGAPNPPKRRQGRRRKVVILIVVVLFLLVVLLLALFAVVVNFVARPYLIPSESMEPTVHRGDRVIVDKLAYRSSSPQPGDVIVFTAPPSWSVGYKSIRSDNTALRWAQNVLSVLGFVAPDENDAIKRVIAVGGETVQCRADTGLTVDGKPLDQPFLNTKTMGVENLDPAAYRCFGPEFGPVTVPEGRLWVMGDNRTHSADSRAHCTSLPADLQRGILCTGDPTSGTIPVDNVIGKVSSARTN